MGNWFISHLYLLLHLCVDDCCAALPWSLSVKQLTIGSTRKWWIGKENMCRAMAMATVLEIIMVGGATAHHAFTFCTFSKEINLQ